MREERFGEEMGVCEGAQWCLPVPPASWKPTTWNIPGLIHSSPPSCEVLITHNFWGVSAEKALPVPMYE